MSILNNKKASKFISKTLKGKDIQGEYDSSYNTTLNSAILIKTI